MGKNEFDQYADSYRALLDKRLAFAGDGAAYYSEYKALYLRGLVGEEFAGKILDFGCGVGLLSGFVLHHLPAAELHGYDVSAESVEEIPAGWKARAKFCSKLSDIDRRYDLIVISNVMHHIEPQQRKSTIESLTALLGRKARMVIFEHNPMNPLTRWVVSHCEFDEDAVLLSVRETVGYLRHAALMIEHKHYLLFFPAMLRSLRRFETGLRWLPLGAQYVVVARAV
jgi:SAM-dependent methyltransferase